MKPDPDAKPLQFEDLKSVFSTDLLQALSNNRPPQEGALRSAASIREDPDSFVAAAMKRRRHIDREIKKLQEERMKLSNEPNVRITLKNACDTISAPIRRVPLDVIREITNFALDDHPSAVWESSPMTLARVCSAWRSAVLSSPRMWSTLYLRLRALDQDSIIKYTRIVQNWFLRASSAPKSFFLYVDCPIPTGAPSHNLKLFLKAIGLSLTKLVHLGIGSHDWAELMLHFAHIEWDVSNLQKLDFLGQVSSVRLDSLTKLASINERITMFKDAQLLTALTATQEMRAFMPSVEFIPWNQLTDISILENYTQHSHLVHAFRNFTKLTTARLTCMDLRARDGAVPVVHENLTQLNLRIGVCNSHDLLTFFSNSIFPNLKKLQISVAKMKATQADDQLLTNNVFPSLEYLDLVDDIRIPTDLLLSLLHGTPKLKVLSMYVSDTDGCNTDVGKVLEAMTIKDGHCDMLPVLEECSFYGIADAPDTKFLLDGSVVSRFIHSRFADLPAGCSALDEIAFGGRFRFLTNIDDEVDLLSDGNNPVDIYHHGLLGAARVTRRENQFADIKWDLSNVHTLELLGQQAGRDEFINDDMEGLELVAERITLFRAAKQLTTLIANQEIASYFSAFTFLPWQTLTNVVLQEGLSGQWQRRKVLVGCPNLLSASLRWHSTEPVVLPPLAPMPIGRLKHLKLNVTPIDWNYLPRFFSMFVFQSLTHLEVLMDEILADADQIIQPIGAIPSSPLLTVFRLDSGFPVLFIIDLLRNMPQLRTFIMKFSGSSTDFNQLFDAMAIDDVQSNILPLIEECSIQRCGPMVLLDVSTLSRFICSRTQDLSSKCASLKKLALTGRFAFLTDLHKEIAHISGVTNLTAEIKMFPIFHTYHDSLDRVQTPHSYFADIDEYPKTYAHQVDHETYLA